MEELPTKLLVILAALIIRWCVSLNSYSGKLFEMAGCINDALYKTLIIAREYVHSPRLTFSAVLIFHFHCVGDLPAIGGFTVTSYAVSRGHPAPLVGKRVLADGLRVYFCLDSYLVYIHFAHTQDHDYVLYLCGGTSGIVWTVRFSLLSSKKMETKKTLVECVQL